METLIRKAINEADAAASRLRDALPFTLSPTPLEKAAIVVVAEISAAAERGRVELRKLGAESPKQQHQSD